MDAQPLAADAATPRKLIPACPRRCCSAALMWQPRSGALPRPTMASGVARAAYFPVFSLSAAAGFESLQAPTGLQHLAACGPSGPGAVLTVFVAAFNPADRPGAAVLTAAPILSWRGAQRLSGYGRITSRRLRESAEREPERGGGVTANTQGV